MSPEAETFWKDWHNDFDVNLRKIEKQFETPYGWMEFDPLRKEIAKCLLSGLYLPAITSTNLLVELFLKVILIYYDVDPPKSNCIAETDRFIKPLEKYNSKNLNDNIISAFDKELITGKEKYQINEWKNEFRNSFSHADIKKIIDNYPSMINQTGLRLVSISRSKACEYFIAVNKLIGVVTSRNFPKHP